MFALPAPLAASTSQCLPSSPPPGRSRAGAASLAGTAPAAGRVRGTLAGAAPGGSGAGGSAPRSDGRRQCARRKPGKEIILNMFFSLGSTDITVQLLS